MSDDRISFDRVSDCYDATRAMPPDMEKAVIERLIEIGDIQAHTRILELGIGTGRIAAPLSDKTNARYYGVDISKKMMEKIRSKKGGAIVPICADICALPFKSSRFDIVLAIHVFHLVKNWRCAIDEAARVLGIGGVIIVGGENENRSTPLEKLVNGLMPKAREEIFDMANRLGFALRTEGMLSFDEAADALQKHGASVTLPPPVDYSIEVPLFAILKLVENRVFQYLWGLPDEKLAAAVSEMTKIFMEHYGNLEVKVSISREFKFVRAAF